MNYVLDSSSLIYLGKLGLLKNITNTKEKFYIPKKVYGEVVVGGRERKEPEILLINELIREKKLIVKKGKYVIKDYPLLSDADKEVIALAKEMKCCVIIDETSAREIACSLGVKVHGSIYFILILLKRKIITKKDALKYINSMITLGFYLSIEKYREILNLINRM